MGYELRDIWRKAFLDLVHPDDREAARRCLTQTEQQGQAEWTFRVLAKSGAYHILEGSSCFEEERHAFYHVARDASERARTAAELDRSQIEVRRVSGFLNNIINTLADPVFAKDDQHRWVLLNEAICKLVGHSRDELLGRSDYEFFPKEEADIFWQKDNEVFNGHGPVENEESLTDSLGSRHIISTKKTVFRDVDGRKVLVGVIRDITDRKRTEEKLRETQERFQHAFDHAPIGMALINPAGGFLRVNTALCRMLGYSREELLQRSIRQVVDPEDWEAEEDNRRRLLNGELETFELEERYVHRSGDRLWVLLNASLVRDDCGAPLYFVAQIQDVTQSREVENELRRAKETAEAANRAKSQFLAHVSHEIRTPMNGVIGMIDLLLDHSRDQEERENLEIVKVSAESLLAIINDILDFSKVEAGKVILHRIDFGLRSAIDQLAALFHLRIEEKGIRFNWAVDEDVPDKLYGDPDRLRQVLINLLSNAIKFTDEGGRIDLTVKRETQSAAGVMLRFAVTDSGIGIPKARQKDLFEAFTQLDASHTRSFAGTGLGLAISLGLVKLMGGAFAVDSEPGRGSTFSFTAGFGAASQGSGLPVGGGTPDWSQAPAARERLNGSMRVLLVEDNPVNQKVAARMIEACGSKAVVAENGLAALEYLDREAFDLVLMDCQMPDKDGFQTTLELRQREEASGRRRTPVFALTAYAMEGDQDRCRAAGMDGYLCKPVKKKELFAVLKRHAPMG